MISLTSVNRTAAHSWRAGPKLAALCAATFALFFIGDLVAQTLILGAVLALYALPGRAFAREGLAKLWLLWPFLAIVTAYHLLIRDLAQGLVIDARMLSAVGLANLVTMTTRLDAMIEVLRWLATPLRRLGLRTAPAELAVALVIRMVPVLVDKGAALSDAWRARSPRRASWRIVLPLTLLALDDADHVSEALMARGGVENLPE